MRRGKIHGRLREARQRACLTQRQLGEKVGVSASLISKLEIDPFSRIDPDLRRELAEVLEVSEEEVWEEPSGMTGSSYNELSEGERAFLGAYMRFNPRSRPRLIQMLKEIDRNEAKKRGKKRE